MVNLARIQLHAQHGVDLILVVVREPRILGIRYVDGIMGHIKIERLIVLVIIQELTHLLNSLPGQCFGKEDIVFCIIVKAGNGVVGVAVGRQVAAGASGLATGDVHIIAHRQRISARRCTRPVVSLAAMDRIIAIVFQHLGQRRDAYAVHRIFRIRRSRRLDTVIVPVRKFNHIAAGVGLRVVVQRPVRHAVASSVHARHQART